MNTTGGLISAVVLAGSLYVSAAGAGEVTFDGSVSPSSAPPGSVRLGTFNPAFDPYSYSLVYGDRYGNMDSPNYSLAVMDGNFRPIGEGTLVGTNFAGTGSASGIEGQQLWLFFFNTSNPDAADQFALLSGATDAWRAPADTGTLHIFADSANEFVFGSGGNGSPIELQGLPIPEPSSLALLAIGMLLVAVTSRRFCLYSDYLPNKRVEPITRSAVTLRFHSDTCGALLALAHPYRWTTER